MATITTGLGGPQGVGEGSFRGTPLTSGNYDDGAIQVNITSVFGSQGISYFGTNYTSIYINTNGLITFGGPQTSYTPTPIQNLPYPAIAVFWSDVNITSGTATGTNNIYWDLDPASGKVTITWLGVRPYSGSTTARNTFQLVLEHTQDGNFEVDFIYQQIQWANGGFGVAQAGMTDGAGQDFVLPGSGNATAITGYPNAQLDPNDPNGVWSTRFLNGRPVCFVTGTRIATPEGPRPVEDLRAGDLVLTRDAGAQPLLWAGGESVLASGAALPVRVEAGVLGDHAPLSVSPRHLLLVAHPACEMLFDVPEVLVAARDLLALPGIRQETVPRRLGYHHLLLGRHHVLNAEGAGAESLYPGPQALADLPSRQVADLQRCLPDGQLDWLARQPMARRVLKPHEARVLCGFMTRSRIKAQAPRLRAA
ncbi:Hint domain-containing protein [Gemmobacter denitrificans]|uniref:Hint domain-containing protein n=1 Tax=Gemmobacter denitrificans TaxID=3123040 RepID=A0ABU8BRS7_9RHOB